MIDKLKVKAFKCFNDEELEFKNLTILTGTNGSGKSSVIQAILKLSLHANNDFSSPVYSYLNFISNFDEVINYDLDVDEYLIGVEGFGGELEYIFKRDENINQCQANNGNIESYLSYSKGNLIFLSADRIGPQDTYNKNTNPYDRFGIYGEYAISYLENSRKSKYKVIEELIFDKDKKGQSFLDREVNYWLNYILDTQMQTEEISGTNQVKARFKNGSEFVRPKNIGSGISYLSSILIVCLSAKIGQIIIIENPEIHLHPKAQAKLGEFFAFIASKGIQLIIETHNDHLINRFRYEIFKGNLDSQDLIIHYKDKNTPFEQIKIGNDGKFIDKNGENSFPKGFYDATLKEIFQINRGS